jgi:hypothetical protein
VALMLRQRNADLDAGPRIGTLRASTIRERVSLAVRSVTGLVPPRNA